MNKWSGRSTRTREITLPSPAKNKKRCLVRAFARVGIIALVHEAATSQQRSIRTLPPCTAAVIVPGLSIRTASGCRQLVLHLRHHLLPSHSERDQPDLTGIFRERLKAPAFQEQRSTSWLLPAQ